MERILFMLNLHVNKAVVMIKWWRGILALLLTPTKEHFCQNPWVGEALSLCHVAGYCINLTRLQSLTVHVIGNIQISFHHLCLPNAVLLWWHFNKMSSIYLHKDIFLTQICKRTSFTENFSFIWSRQGSFLLFQKWQRLPDQTTLTEKAPKFQKHNSWEKGLSSVKFFMKGSRPCWQHNTQHWWGQSLTKTHLKIKSRINVQWCLSCELRTQ